MWFGVLGPLEVRDDAGQVVRVGGSVRRELLAALLCRAGEFVPAAALIDDIWDAVPPRTAAKTLQSHVVRLRHDLAQSDGAVIVTEGAGYRIDVSAATLDAVSFEAELNEGLTAFRRQDDRLAIEHLDAALALWRGEAYLDFADAPFALNERVRLADLRAMALEMRTDAALRLGEAATLISELENRIRRAPYRERTWEQLILALYRSGRQADALAGYRMAHQRLSSELGVDPGPALRAIEMRILNQDPTLLVDSTAIQPHGEPQVVLRQCPYRGLGGYGSDDAAVFVGRERLTAVLAGRLADAQVVVVAGASGSGKSSVVRAGLVPALRAGALPRSAAWRVIVSTPTSPARAVSTIDVLVLDQAEELFTVLDESERTGVLERLRGFVEGGGRLVVVLRGDFFGALADVPWLARHAQRDAVLIGRMREDELARVIVEPSRRAGVKVAEEVTDTILDESAGQPQPLPLVSVALVRAWEERDGDVITPEAYQASGGLVSAIEATAEATYARLPEALKAEARLLLVRMAVREGAAWVRRPLPREAVPSAASGTVLDTLAEGRLITVTEGRVELSHDALLEHWPRLRGWLDERVMAAGLLEHLTAATNAWLAGGRQETDLHRGPRLQASLDWRDAHPDDLSRDERDFLMTSAAAVEAFQQDRLRAARHTARQLRLLVAGLVVLLIAAVAGGSIAVHQRSVARDETLHAEVSRLATLASTLPDNQRDLALLLGAQAYQLQPSDEAVGSLQSALMQTPPGLDRIIRYRSSSLFPHLDHTGRLLAVPGDDGTVAIENLVTGRVMHTFTWPTPRQFAVFSGDDRLVAAGGADGKVAVWDLRTGALSGRPLPVGSGVVRAVFDPRDDNRIYVLSSHGTLSAWDRNNPNRPRDVGAFVGAIADLAFGPGSNLAISPDGRLLVAGEIDPGTSNEASTRVWDTRSDQPLHAGFTGAVGVLARDGVTLPFGYGNDTVLWNAKTGRIEDTVPNTGGNPLATVSPDGHRIAVAERLGGAAAVAVYDLDSHRRVAHPVTLHGESAYPLGFLPDGRLVTTSPNNAAIWTIGAQLPPLGVQLDTRPSQGTGGDAQPVFLSGSREVLTVTGDQLTVDQPGPPLLHDPRTGRVTAPLFNGRIAGQVAVSSDGRFIIGAFSSGGLGIWNAHSAAPLALLPGTQGTPVKSFTSLRWSPRGDLVAANVGGSGYLWSVANPRHPSKPIPINIPHGGIEDDALFTPDGQRLLTVSGGHTVLTMIDIASAHDLWTHTVHESDGVEQAVVSPDGATIAFHTGNTDAGAVTLLDAATGIREASIPVQSNGGVGYLNHGRWLVITSNQPSPQAQIYDAKTRQPIGVPFPTGSPDQDPLAVDPRGTRFSEIVGYNTYNGVSPSSPDPIVWNADPANWLATACKIAGRNLTQAEWHQYLPDRTYHTTCPQWPTSS